MFSDTDSAEIEREREREGERGRERGDRKREGREGREKGASCDTLVHIKAYSKSRCWCSSLAPAVSSSSTNQQQHKRADHKHRLG